jgi:predicted nucleotidyltransferase component of viral defense system
LKKTAANLPASVRQRLLNLATERKEDFGLVVTRYGLERFLYRLSVSPHRDSFVLKGALLLQLWTADTYRPTRDLDLLGRGISNVSYRKIFSEVCSQKVEDDGLTFLPDTIRVERIRDDEAYEGVRVRLEARLGNVRVPLQIDVGLGDTIVPSSEELEYPTLLRFPAPKLHAYSKESVVAEKFEAMVKLGIANSRMKDFYDLCVLAQRFEFEMCYSRRGHPGNIQNPAHDLGEIVAASVAAGFLRPSKQANAMAGISAKERTQGRFFPEGNYRSHSRIRDASCGRHFDG